MRGSLKTWHLFLSAYGVGESEQGWTRRGNYAKMDLYEFHSGEAGAIKTDTCVTNEQKTWSASQGWKEKTEAFFKSMKNFGCWPC